MAMRAGRFLREQWALERAGAVPCRCGHPISEHRQLRQGTDPATFEPVDHPDYIPNEFWCTGCACHININWR